MKAGKLDISTFRLSQLDYGITEVALGNRFVAIPLDLVCHSNTLPVVLAPFFDG